MRFILLLSTFAFAACTADSTPSAGLSNQEDVSASPDLITGDDTAEAPEDVMEADTCWWCEDAGPTNPEDPEIEDGVDQNCYQGCVDKGQDPDFCADYCSKNGGKGDGGDDGKGDDGKGDGDDGKGDDAEANCYADCVAKGEAEDVCAAYCSENFGDGGGDDGKGDGDDGDGDDGGGNGDQGDGGDSAAEEACYEGCVAKGEDADFCADYCEEAFGGDGGDDDANDDDDDQLPDNVNQACYDACIEKGQPEDACVAACSDGNGGGK